MGKCLLHEQEGEERELAFASTSFLFFFASTTVNLFAAFLPLFVFSYSTRAHFQEFRKKKRARARETNGQERVLFSGVDFSRAFFTFLSFSLFLTHSTLTSPSKTHSAGPVMYTVPPTPPPSTPSSATHSMNSGPPGKSTRHFLSSFPSRTPATTVAHAPVPQASVGPAPLSQTRILQCEGLRTWTNSTLVLAGKTGDFSCFGGRKMQSRERGGGKGEKREGGRGKERERERVRGRASSFRRRPRDGPGKEKKKEGKKTLCHKTNAPSPPPGPPGPPRPRPRSPTRRSFRK